MYVARLESKLRKQKKRAECKSKVSIHINRENNMEMIKGDKTN